MLPKMRSTGPASWPRRLRKPCSSPTSAPLVPLRSRRVPPSSESRGALLPPEQVSGTPLPFGGAQRLVGVDDDPGGVAQFEVEVGGGALGVAAVAHPADQFPGLHVDPGADAGGDAPALAVVGAGAVVVEVDVVGLPAVVVAQGERAALVGAQVVGVGGPVDVLDAPGGGRHDRQHLGPHEVLGVVVPVVPLGVEPVGVGDIPDDGEDQGVVHHLAVGVGGGAAAGAVATTRARAAAIARPARAGLRAAAGGASGMSSPGVECSPSSSAPVGDTFTISMDGSSASPALSGLSGSGAAASGLGVSE